MAIQQTRIKVGAERAKLKKYQTGDIQVVHTGRPHIDANLSGLLPGDIVVIAGASGAGKSFELQTIRENIMDTNINPFADEYVFLDYSFEMKLFNLILRGLNKVIDKSKKRILLEEFNEEEKALANRYIQTLMDDRYYIEENPLTPEEFIAQTRQFLTANQDKRAVIVAIDHMGLFKSGSGGEKKSAIDKVVEAVNILKKEFPNAIFLLLSQLNRNILSRIYERDINAKPNRADVFQSDTMFHIADYLIVVHNPNRIGISQYLKVNPNAYEYLAEHFIESEGVSDKVSFETLGNIFYHVLKIREGEVVFKDIYIETIEIENITLYKNEKIDVKKEFEELDFNDN